MRLRFAFHVLGPKSRARGDLNAAARAIEQECAIAEATGTSPVAFR